MGERGARAARWLAIIGLGGLLLWAFAVRLGLLHTGKEHRILDIHSRVVPFRLPLASEDSGTVALRDLRHRGVLLSFWATWCAVCRRQLPLVSSLHERYAGEHFTVLAVSDEPEHVVRAYLKAHPVPFPVVTDPTGRLRARFGVDVLPLSIYIAPNGRVAGRHVGILHDHDVNVAVQHLIVDARQAARKRAEKAVGDPISD